MIKEKTYFEFLKPDFVYIPFSSRELLTIKLNMILTCNKLLGKQTNNENIYSTCSGKLLTFTEVDTVGGKTNSMVVENDFREKRAKLTGMKRNMQSFSKEELLNRLNEYSLNYFTNIKNLVVLVEYTRGVDNSDSFTLKENIDEILESLDAVQTILDINLCVVVNNKDSDSTNMLFEHIGTYPNLMIETVSKEYTSVSYDNLLKRIYGKTDGSKVITLDMFNEIYFALKKNKNLTNKIISVSYGRKLINVNVKIGTRIDEMLEYLGIKAESVKLFKGSTKTVKSNEAIITKDLKAIII